MTLRARAIWLTAGIIWTLIFAAGAAGVGMTAHLAVNCFAWGWGAIH